MNAIAQAYFEGIITKCAEYGIDAEQLVKNAQLGALAPQVAQHGIASLGRKIIPKVAPKFRFRPHTAVPAGDIAAEATRPGSAIMRKISPQQLNDIAVNLHASHAGQMGHQIHVKPVDPRTGMQTISDKELARPAAVPAASAQEAPAVKPAVVGADKQTAAAQVAEEIKGQTQTAPTLRSRIGNWAGAAAVPAGAYAMAKGEQYAKDNPTIQSGIREVGEYANDLGNAYNGAPLGTR